MQKLQIMAVLQKKLEELESDLNKLLHDNSVETDISCQNQLFQSIDHRFTFLKSLLLAEMESHHHNPHRLHHIDQRLAELETVFLNWVHLFTSSSDCLDALSTCSCTSSCLNEGGLLDDDLQFEDNGKDDDEEEEDTEAFSHQESKETATEMALLAEEVQEAFSCPEFKDTAAEAATPTTLAAEGGNEEKKRFSFLRYWREIGVMVFAAAVGALAASGFFKGPYYHRENVFLVPT